tara:strand:+ start:1418 stop:2011 length:594 start_codon:yes stop_codon:yes gene_type:complete
MNIGGSTIDLLGIDPLQVVDVVGETFYRIVKSEHSSGLGTGFGASRFVPPPPTSFKALYAAADLDTAFAEAVLRDRAAGKTGRVPLTLAELQAWDVVEIAVDVLKLADFRPECIGTRLDTDALFARDHKQGQEIGLRMHDDPAGYGGMIFRSRLTNSQNIVVFDRAIVGGLLEKNRTPLLMAGKFGETMDKFQLAII